MSSKVLGQIKTYKIASTLLFGRALVYPILRYLDYYGSTRSRCPLQSLLRFAPERISTAIAHANQYVFIAIAIFFIAFAFTFFIVIDIDILLLLLLLILPLLFPYVFPPCPPLLWRGLGRGQRTPV